MESIGDQLDVKKGLQGLKCGSLIKGEGAYLSDAMRVFRVAGSRPDT